MPRLHRFRRAFAGAAFAACAIAAFAPDAGAQPDPHLATLGYHGLMGTWACAGSDERSVKFTATLRWGFNDGGAFYFMAEPKPATRAHPRIAEIWEWDDAGSVWRAIPDAGTAEQVQSTSGGWVGTTLLWVRMAAESTLDRAFVRAAPNRLTVRSERGILSSGSGPMRKHRVYELACRRTVDDSPR